MRNQASLCTSENAEWLHLLKMLIATIILLYTNRHILLFTFVVRNLLTCIRIAGVNKLQTPIFCDFVFSVIFLVSLLL